MAAGQAQKHVTHNEALLQLDAAVQLAVEDTQRISPPAAPQTGDRYLIAAGAGGAWAGHAGEIAIFQDAGWQFLTPRKGWRLWAADSRSMLVHDGAAWVPLKIGVADRLGVNATADAANRLAVASPGVLLNHEGAGHQLKINKATAADTGSLLFQTGFSGRAEIGLAGGEDFSLKVSGDGTTWREAARIDRATGFWGLAGASPAAPLTVGTDATGLAAGQAAIVVKGGLGAERIECRGVSDAGPNAALQGFGARGTLATPAATRNGDRLFAVVGSGYDGSAFVVPFSAAVDILASGDWTAASHGSAVIIRTTPAGATSAQRAERLRILDNGNVRIGADGVAQTKLDVDGPVRVKSYTVAGLPGATASGAGAIVFVTNEAGGAVLAFSDGAVWRRVTDRVAVS
jgi:hypothetical protein